MGLGDAGGAGSPAATPSSSAAASARGAGAARAPSPRAFEYHLPWEVSGPLNGDDARGLREKPAHYQQQLEGLLGRPGEAAAAALPGGHLRQALAEHARALREAASEHEAELRKVAVLVGEELGRQLGSAVRRAVEEASPGDRSSPHVPAATLGDPEERPGLRSAEEHGAADIGRSRSRRTRRSCSDDGIAGSTPFRASDTMQEHVNVIANPATNHDKVSSDASTYGVGPIASSIIEQIEHALTGCWEEAEPARTSGLACIVTSRPFSLLCSAVICLNTVFIIWGVNDAIRNSGKTDYLHVYSEPLFTAWYIVELALKLLVHRRFFFTSREDAWFNMLDLCLVLLSVLEIALAFLHEDRSGVDPMFLRTLRIFKIARVLRMFRAVRAFSDFRLMIHCVVHSFWPLVWAIALLTFLSCLFAICFVQTLAVNMESGDLDPKDERMLLEQFWSVEAAMLSLLMATTGGEDWVKTYNTLLPLGQFAVGIFIFYIAFMHVAVMNIVTSVFLDKAMKLAQPNLETIMMTKRYQDMVDTKELMEMVAEMDTRNTGYITFSDFQNFMQMPRFRLYFDVRGLNIKDTAMFFRMLASSGMTQATNTGEHVVDISSFVAGCMRLKGSASSMDMYTLSWEMKILRRSQQKFMEWTALQFGDLRVAAGLPEEELELPMVSSRLSGF